MTASPIRSALVQDPDFAEIVSAFVEEVPKRVESIRNTFAEQDRKRLCTLVHQLRGACGSYGFHELTPLATTLEFSLRSTVPLEQLLPQVEEFLEACLRMTDE